MPVDREARDLSRIQSKSKRHAFEAALLAEHGAKPLLVGLGYLQEVAQVRDQRVHVAHGFRDHFEAEGRRVLGQNSPVAVEDEAPRRSHRHDLDAIVLGQGLEVLVLHDLELEHAHHQRRQQGNDQHARHHRARAKQLRLLGHVFEGQGGGHGST